jgi:hypothetical protein
MDPHSNQAVASAESEALAKEQAESQAEGSFRAMREELERAGKAQDVTHSAEFRHWMQARAETDAAWGRWAMAVDVLRAPG